MRCFPWFWSNRDVLVTRAGDSFDELVTTRATEKRAHVMKCAANRGQLVFRRLSAPVAPAASRGEVNGDGVAKLVCCHCCFSLSVIRPLRLFLTSLPYLFPLTIPSTSTEPVSQLPLILSQYSFRYVRYARCRRYIRDTPTVHREAVNLVMSGPR
jgi:hypothetical protein